MRLLILVFTFVQVVVHMHSYGSICLVAHFCHNSFYLCCVSVWSSLPKELQPRPTKRKAARGKKAKSKDVPADIVQKLEVLIYTDFIF